MEAIDKFLGKVYGLGLGLCIPLLMLTPVIGGVFMAALVDDAYESKLIKYPNIKDTIFTLVFMLHTFTWFAVMYFLNGGL